MLDLPWPDSWWSSRPKNIYLQSASGSCNIQTNRGYAVIQQQMQDLLISCALCAFSSTQSYVVIQEHQYRGQEQLHTEAILSQKKRRRRRNMQRVMQPRWLSTGTGCFKFHLIHLPLDLFLKLLYPLNLQCFSVCSEAPAF